MKKSFIISILCLLTLSVSAQQYPLHTNYMFNALMYNPGLTGSSADPMARISMRKQWVGIDGSPFTGFASYDQQVGSGPLAAGGYILSDVLGYLNRTGASGLLSYQMDFGEGRNLGLGLSAGVYRIFLDGRYNAQTVNDITLINAEKGKWLPDISLGIYYHTPKWFAGLSMPQAFSSKADFSKQGIENVYRLEKTWTGFAGVNLPVNEVFVLQPMLVGRFARPAVFQIDASAKLSMHQKYWVMASYRLKDAASLSAGAWVSDNMEIAYGYDLTVSGLASYSSGSHEVMLAYRFGDCKDRDGDGVCDKDDACPDEPGPADNDGCPVRLSKKDMDDDGIPDDEDDCPNTAGLFENKGCPVLSLEQQETIDFAVKNLEFKFDKDVIEDTSKPYLDKLARLMIEEKDWKLKVSGHTDSEGSEEYNIKLSRSRAYAVRNYLMKKGVSKDRILVEFFGEYVPLTENRSEEGRQRNRRVEMIFIFE